MPTSRREERILETYARSLAEAAKAEGRVVSDGRVLDALASASPEVLTVVRTLVERDELDLLPRVAASFHEVLEADDDVAAVRVTTAVPLDDGLRAEITAHFEADLGCKVFLIEQVDPSIIGGIVVEARGARRDASVRAQLRATREAMTGEIANMGGDPEHV